MNRNLKPVSAGIGKTFILIVFTALICGAILGPVVIEKGLFAQASVKNEWNTIGDIFPAVSKALILPDNIIKLDNTYINPEHIASLTVTSEFTADIILDNNAKFSVFLQKEGQLTDFINRVLAVMKK
jgi:hypothetical protein